MNTVITIDNKTESQANTINGKVIKKAGKRIGYYYIIYKSLKESVKNDVIKCLFIKKIYNFGFCVIKEGTYGDVKDKNGRDIKDRLLWQKSLHEKLQNIISIPKLLDSFEENGNYYLVLEFIRGKSLYETRRNLKGEFNILFNNKDKTATRFIDYLLQITTLLQKLHNEKIIHRDATATNFIINKKGKVIIIDMELSYSLDSKYPSPPFQLGTHGYMSPEQEAVKEPTVGEDIFSLGAIIFQVWTGISPYKITKVTKSELEKSIRFFILDKNIADIVIQCLNPIAQERPKIDLIKKVIINCKTDLKEKKTRKQNTSIPFSLEEIQYTMQSSLNALGSPLLTDIDKGWFSDRIQSNNNVEKKIDKTWYASFNRGTAGIMYTLSQAHKIGFDISNSYPSIQKGLELIKQKYILRIDKISGGLHFGGDGIAVCLTTAMDCGLLKSDPEYWTWIENLLKRPTNALNIASGVSGQGLANLLCNNYNDSHIIDRLINYTTHILDRQEKDGSWKQILSNSKIKYTRGFTNGVAGIIYYLLEYSKRFNNNEAMFSAERGLNWLMKKSIHKGVKINWRSSNGKEIAPWLSEGAPGIALPFMKAWEITNIPIYKKYALGALNNHSPKQIDSNLSQAYGLAGLGEIYLEAFKIFKDDHWLNRSNWLVQVIMQLKKQDNQKGTYWLVENERHPVANFMIGNSGILHFLLRANYPDKINLPLSPI